MTGLYVHIPFCVRKCLYCDFYSLPTGRGPLARRLQDAETHDASLFLDALERELRQLPPDFVPETVFLGGGTPTELSDPDFRRLFALLHQHVRLDRVREWSCESNPGTLTRDKVLIMLDHGVNRVSLGVQSFDAQALEFLGRIHSSDEAVAGYQLLRDCGVRNVNLDLMYGVPGVPRAVVASDLDRLVALAPDHAACYCLIFEDGTPLNDLRTRGFVKEVEDDEELEQYQLVRRRLTAAGYAHYEISNFARPGRECLHNLLYWGDGQYLGCGPSAHSHWQGARFGNVRKLDEYCRRLLGGEPARSFEERLEPEAKARETLVMALRRTAGVEREAFRRSTGYDYRVLGRDVLPWLAKEGLVEDDGERLRLTESGLFVSDGIFAELV